MVNLKAKSSDRATALTLYPSINVFTLCACRLRSPELFGPRRLGQADVHLQPGCLEFQNLRDAFFRPLDRRRRAHCDRYPLFDALLAGTFQFTALDSTLTSEVEVHCKTTTEPRTRRVPATTRFFHNTSSCYDIAHDGPDGSFRRLLRPAQALARSVVFRPRHREHTESCQLGHALQLERAVPQPNLGCRLFRVAIHIYLTGLYRAKAADASASVTQCLKQNGERW